MLDEHQARVAWLREADAQRRRNLQTRQAEELRREEIDRLRRNIVGEGRRRRFAQKGMTR